ncbi:hypothetical protein M0R45_009848 [Rubus argutus]|uniref:Uncharacterized protein n=1 Tax=Rubus argutus TaxID=59490 RepID=A0AAW1Y5M9_RUBAR
MMSTGMARWWETKDASVGAVEAFGRYRVPKSVVAAAKEVWFPAILAGEGCGLVGTGVVLRTDLLTSITDISRSFDVLPDPIVHSSTSFTDTRDLKLCNHLSFKSEMVATRTSLVSREIGGEERKKKFGVDLLPDVEVRHREGDVVSPMYKQLPS